MKEYAIQALSAAREREKWGTEVVWAEDGFSTLKSLVETGIEPKKTILALSFSGGDLLQDYIDRQRELINPENIYNELDEALTIFNNIVTEIWIDPDDQDSPLATATIEDFLDIKAEDLEGFGDLTLLQRKIIERLFSSSTSNPKH